MKMYKSILIVFVLLVVSTKGQITFDATYSVGNPLPTGSNLYLTKLGSAGYKYVVDDHSTKTIRVYNINHSLLSTITVPLPANITSYFIAYLSDNLFNLTNDIEYMAVALGAGALPKTYVFNDSGLQLFFKDSCSINTSLSYGEVFINSSSIFFNGQSTKMKLSRFSSLNTSIASRWDIYTLPGSIPCIQCSATGTVLGKAEINAAEVNDPVFYPNPAGNQLKLKYTLPKNYNTAEIKIMDLQGKLIEIFKITDDFDFIYLPSDYNSGVYFYSLIVDGKLIKTEKIVLDK